MLGSEDEAAVRGAREPGTSGNDRQRYPWREPVLGKDFLTPVDDVQGVARHALSTSARTS
jgi:hypothetical protein